jgi:hypothetical protein
MLNIGDSSCIPSREGYNSGQLPPLAQTRGTATLDDVIVGCIVIPSLAHYVTDVCFECAQTKEASATTDK